jgi:hypothetical protein
MILLIFRILRNKKIISLGYIGKIFKLYDKPFLSNPRLALEKQLFSLENDHQSSLFKKKSSITSRIFQENLHIRVSTANPGFSLFFFEI